MQQNSSNHQVFSPQGIALHQLSVSAIKHSQNHLTFLINECIDTFEICFLDQYPSFTSILRKCSYFFPQYAFRILSLAWKSVKSFKFDLDMNKKPLFRIPNVGLFSAIFTIRSSFRNTTSSISPKFLRFQLFSLTSDSLSGKEKGKRKNNIKILWIFDISEKRIWKFNALMSKLLMNYSKCKISLFFLEIIFEIFLILSFKCCCSTSPFLQKCLKFLDPLLIPWEI